MESQRTFAAKRVRLAALAVALSLAVSACGADAGTADEAAAAPSVAAAPADSASTDAAPAEGDAAPVEGDAAPVEGDAAAAPTADGGDETATAPVENLFPDVDVLNVADGSSVNLAAELGGGDKATLLWFWAPH